VWKIRMPEDIITWKKFCWITFRWYIDMAAFIDFNSIQKQWSAIRKK